MSAVRLLGILPKITSTNIKILGNKGHCNVNQSKMFSSAAAQTHTKSKIVDNVYVITLDTPNSKVNSLSKEVMAELQTQIGKAKADPSVSSAVLISGKPGCFIAGADINMLAACKTYDEVKTISEEGKHVLNEVEQMSKPVVAAIMGSCLGGGLETALACHYRIAVKDKKTALGLPEVMLGLLPGGGGTQRLPRLTSIPTALDLELTGKSVRADKAKKLGIVDRLVDPLGPGLNTPENRTMEYLEEVAVEAAKQIAAGTLKVDRKKSLVDNLLNYALKFDWVKNQIFSKAKTQVMKLTGGLYPAPLKILEVIRTGLEKGPAAGFEAESNGFAELAMTPQSKGLIALFKGQTECKKNRFGKPQQNIKYE